MTEIKIFTKEELASRYHVRLERYIKNMTIEVDTLKAMVSTQILPSCFSYVGDLATQVAACKTAAITPPQQASLEKIAKLSEQLQKQVLELEQVNAKLEKKTSEDEKAAFLASDVATLMEKMRHTADELESLVADDAWPLPKYREMLFLA